MREVPQDSSSCSKNIEFTRSLKESKFVVLGAGRVGKTSLIKQFLEGDFTPSYEPTVEDSYKRVLRMPDGMYRNVEIVDTSGTHQFPAMQELNVRSGGGFLLVFALDDMDTLYRAIEIWKLIVGIRGMRVPIVLVGNKSDLAGERQVTAEFVTEIVGNQLINCPYAETSAKLNFNVYEMFRILMEKSAFMSLPPTPPATPVMVSPLLPRKVTRKLMAMKYHRKLSIRRNFRNEAYETSGRQQQSCCCILL